VLHLDDRFDPANVEGSPTPSKASEPRLEWRFDGEGAPGFAGSGIEALGVREGRLRGRTREGFPVVAIDASAARGVVPDLVHSIEVRARIPAGGNLWVEIVPSDQGAIAELLPALQTFPWLATTPILPVQEMNTYVLIPDPGSPKRSSDIGRILIRPSDEPGRDFELESIRVVLRREHLAAIASGVSWQGLGGIYRKTLVSRSPEIIRFDLELPGGRPYLDLGVGTIEETPVTFRVALKSSGGSREEETQIEHTVTTPNRWEDSAVDLSRYAGRRVALSMKLDSGRASALGFWGSPVIRSRAPDDSQGVVVIFADTLRRDHLNSYGYERSTAPALARMADEGTLFRNTVTQATWTKPSAASFFTSRYPTSHGVREWRDRVPATADILAELYRRAGYATFSFASNGYTGQATNLHQGFEVVHEPSSIAIEDRGKTSRAGVDRLIDWMEAHRDVPFFAFMSLLDPHPPFKPRAPYDTRWADPAREREHERRTERVRTKIENPLLRHQGLPTIDELLAAGVDPEPFIAHLRDWYDGSIRGLDAEMGRLFDALRGLGLDRRTLVLFTSDHGEEFLEHGRTFHGHSVYGEQSLVPLILWQPGRIPSGKVVEEPVQTIDLMPTLIELAGLPRAEGMQGRSLGPLLSLAAETSTRAGDDYRRRLSELGWSHRAVITEQPLSRDERHEGASVAILDSGWKLVRHTIRSDRSQPEYELFDFENDPLDQHDVARDHPDVLERLARALEAWRVRAEAEKLESDGVGMEKIDAEELRRLRALGYIQ
jgi:arylsulfatase A-like enzyme